ncbi:TTL15-like protein [Mya arenaria]|uniref:TTL15-like protein n=1 Tax=Mya arenaria TaxID=6604 RepID=A0ABY7FHI2_MYAAR|nr:TTL15-like protein [Mya arenaria]
MVATKTTMKIHTKFEIPEKEKDKDVGLLLTALNVYELQQMREEHMLHRDDHPITIVEGSMGRSPNNSPVVWILGKHMETGYLTHVKTVFERLGFHVTNGEDDWDAKSHPETMWVQKNNNHRGVRIKQLDELDFESEGSFVQEFVAKPLLIDKRNFFELVRFDFVLDEDLKLFLMEVNMSPNLSTNHFKGNKRLYQHVIDNDADEMLASDKEITVFSEWCSASECQGTTKCSVTKCRLCSHCLELSLRTSLKDAYLEHYNKGGCMRIFPPTMILCTFLNLNILCFNGKLLY